MTTTGRRLRELREAKQLSQSDVAKLIGVGRTTYLKYETGENKPVRKLNELANFFNVSIDYILGKDEIASNITVTDDEGALVKGYRELDDAGKAAVRYIINTHRPTSYGRGNRSLHVSTPA